MVPIITCCPIEKPVTSAPSSITSPTISWPGTSGYSLAQWLTECRSEWHTPQYCTLTAMSLGRKARRSNFHGTIAPSFSRAA